MYYTKGILNSSAKFYAAPRCIPTYSHHIIPNERRNVKLISPCGQYVMFYNRAPKPQIRNYYTYHIGTYVSRGKISIPIFRRLLDLYLYRCTLFYPCCTCETRQKFSYSMLKNLLSLIL